MARLLHTSPGGVAQFMVPAPPAVRLPGAWPAYGFDYRSTGAPPDPRQVTTEVLDPSYTLPTPMRLNIGGRSAREGWQLMRTQVELDVDYVGDCGDLNQFATESCDEIYAHHLIEHLPYKKELPAALAQLQRMLKPGGLLRVSVPDLDSLCRLMLDPRLSTQERFHIMRILFGGQADAKDFHYVGLSFEFMVDYLTQAGFRQIRRVTQFPGFKGTSVDTPCFETPISLNIEALKE